MPVPPPDSELFPTSPSSGVDAPVSSPARRRALTWRSVLFATLGMFLMSGIAGYHDNYCYSTGPLMIGNHLPGGALAYLILVGLVWNGIAGRISKRLALGPGELTVVLCATLVSCFPPTSGLFRYATRHLMLPWYHLPGKPDWAAHGLLDFLPRSFFPWPGPDAAAAAPGTDEALDYQRVYQGYFTGLVGGTQDLPLSEIPFADWGGALLRWGPLVFLFALSSIALLFLVYRQWADHEQLSFPVAQVAGSFCARADGRPGVPDIFRNRLFWYGFSPVFAYYLLDFLGAKFPATFPTMREVFPALKSWWVAVYGPFPAVKHGGWYFWNLCGQSLFFTIVGVAYFVSTEISLTMGLSSFLTVAFGMAYYYTTGAPIGGGRIEISCFGAYVGYTAMLLWTGRSYFRRVFARAFSRRLPLTGDDAASMLAARVFVVAFLGFSAMLRLAGFDWPFALLFAATAQMCFLVVTRILCETGIPFLSFGFNPMIFQEYILGAGAVGPRDLVLGRWFFTILMHDPRECLMPYVATAAKVADARGLRLRRVFWGIVGTVALALCIAFVATLRNHYTTGAMTDSYASGWSIIAPFNRCAAQAQQLKDIGDWPLALQGTVLQRLSLLRASPPHLRFFLFGIVAVVGVSALRYRFSRFPIHPVLFLTCGSYTANACWGSFLIGWFLKTLVVRFGGGRSYQRLKPLFIGLVAGEVLFVGVNVIYNLAYILIMHTGPTAGIRVLPG